MKYAPDGPIYNNVASNKAIDWNRWETIVHGNHKNMSELIIWIPGSIPYNHNNTKNNNVFLHDIYSAVLLKRCQFSPKSSQNTPHSSPVRVCLLGI